MSPDAEIAVVRRCQLMDYLPAVFSEGEELDVSHSISQPEPVWTVPVLNEYLKPYEQILLTGYKTGYGQWHGLEQEIGRVPELLDPETTDEALLPWLGMWAAFASRKDIPAQRIRRALSRLISLYRIRGTSEYLETLLELFVEAAATVVDAQPEFEVNRHSTIGVKSYVGGGSPWYFRVYLRFSSVTAGRAELTTKLATEIIELAKPAHTAYSIELVMPRMQIGVRSTINMDSIL